MIKYVTVLCVVATLCTAAPQGQNSDVVILRYDNDVQPDGYDFAYELSDGTSRQESGKLDNPQSEDAALNVNGQYSYVGPDGRKVSVVYTAGPNGFQPKTSIGQKK